MRALYWHAITVRAREPHFIHVIHRTTRLISIPVTISIRIASDWGLRLVLFRNLRGRIVDEESVRVQFGVTITEITSASALYILLDYPVQESLYFFTVLYSPQNMERTKSTDYISPCGVIFVSIFSIAKCVCGLYNSWRVRAVPIILSGSSRCFLAQENRVTIYIMVVSRPNKSWCGKSGTLVEKRSVCLRSTDRIRAAESYTVILTQHISVNVILLSQRGKGSKIILMKKWEWAKRVSQRNAPIDTSQTWFRNVGTVTSSRQLDTR